jgi:hypothetical protein
MPAEYSPNVGNDLLRIHKVITRALNISVQNCQDKNLTEKHWQGFVTYVRALTILLDSHHAGEDELSFPFWRTRLPEGPFDELTEQHCQMVSYLDRIKHWLSMAPSDWQSDFLLKLHSTLIDLQALWLTHIKLEEATIGPENSNRYLTLAENEQLTRQLADHGQLHAQPGELVMPFIVYNLSSSDRAEFIRLLPPMMIEQLIPIAWKAVWTPMSPFLLIE